ncbi:MAG: hypothetical protein HYS08_03995 [Chlamydiae bacterium]|nr:hypothetical protein [Chlamydiota bacterium]MBI3266078.1 hypothetical protein [Chlamydiota bacterium]
MKKHYPLAFFLGFLIPGAGHFYLGRKGLGFFLSLSILSLYGIGLWLGGGILWEEMNPLTVLAYVVKFFNGLPFLLTLRHEITQMLSFSFNEVGTTFILVSGSLNLLVLLNLIETFREYRGGK